MNRSDPKKTGVHIVKKIPFSYVTNYIKAIRLIDPTARKVISQSLSYPYVPLTFNFNVAISPKSTCFCGTYVENWELGLN